MGFNPVDLAFGHMDALQSANERLKAENAKLRELASLMWCELHAEQGSAQRRMEIADRLRELEIGGG